MHVLIFHKDHKDQVIKLLTDTSLINSTNDETPADSDLVRLDIHADVPEDVLNQLSGVKNLMAINGSGGVVKESEIHPDQSGKDLPVSAGADSGNPSTSVTSAPGTIPATQQVTTTADTGETTVSTPGVPATTGATTTAGE